MLKNGVSLVQKSFVYSVRCTGGAENASMARPRGADRFGTRRGLDLAGELGAVIQYLTCAAKASGPYRPQLSQFFLAEVAEVAEAFGGKGLAVQLEDMVRDESGHSEETARILKDWSL